MRKKWIRPQQCAMRYQHSPMWRQCNHSIQFILLTFIKARRVLAEPLIRSKSGSNILFFFVTYKGFDLERGLLWAVFRKKVFVAVAEIVFIRASGFFVDPNRDCIQINFVYFR